MNEPIHLTYELDRRDRLVPHLRIWLQYLPVLIGSVAFSLYATIFWSIWWIVALILSVFIYRGFIFGLVHGLLVPRQTMDIIFEPLGIGYLENGERWYVHVDGIIGFDQLRAGIWTIFHTNGTVINVPVEILPETIVVHIRETMSKGWSYLEPFADERRRSRDNEALDRGGDAS